MRASLNSFMIIDNRKTSCLSPKANAQAKSFAAGSIRAARFFVGRFLFSIRTPMERRDEKGVLVALSAFHAEPAIPFRSKLAMALVAKTRIAPFDRVINLSANDDAGGHSDISLRILGPTKPLFAIFD